MRHDKKRILKICEELTVFFFSSGAENITTNIQVLNGKYVVTYLSDYSPKHRKDMENLTEYFNHDSYFGAEEEYWGLAGTGEVGEGTELLLLGMMVKNADIEINDKQVKLVLTIKSH